jgi:hypothetical protein
MTIANAKYSVGTVVLYRESPPNFQALKNLGIFSNEAINKTMESYENGNFDCKAEVVKVWGSEDDDEPIQYSLKPLSNLESIDHPLVAIEAELSLWVEKSEEA